MTTLTSKFFNKKNSQFENQVQPATNQKNRPKEKPTNNKQKPETNKLIVKPLFRKKTEAHV